MESLESDIGSGEEGARVELAPQGNHPIEIEVVFLSKGGLIKENPRCFSNLQHSPRSPIGREIDMTLMCNLGILKLRRVMHQRCGKALLEKTKLAS